MIKPPLIEQPASSAELDALFVEHDFESILSRCEQFTVEDRYYPEGHPAHPDTIHKHGTKYRLNGVTVAVIFHYTHIDKTITRHIRILRVGDARFSVIQQAPVHPQNE